MTKQSNKNKFLATAVTATMVATAFAPVASVAAAQTTFPDVDPNVVGQSSADAVAALAEAGIIKGIDGQFKPGASISRAEASQMVAKLFDLKTGEVKNETTFEDVKDNAWYTGAINSLVEKDILKGKSATSFEPGSDIKRSELALVLVKAYGLQDVNVDDVELPYTDVKAGSWYEKSVKILYKEGLLKGTTATTFSPDSPMKRVDFARLAVETDYAHGTKLPKPTEAVAVESVKAINAKTIEVTFNTAVDTDKAKVELLRGTFKQNVTVKWADDKKSVQLIGAGNFQAADYTVNVTGLSDKALTGSVKIEAQKVASIEILDEVAVLSTAVSYPIADAKVTATVGYVVKDQYGTDITDDKKVTTNDNDGIKAEKGKITIQNSNLQGKNIGDLIPIVLINSESGVTTTKTVKLSAQSSVAKVKGLNLVDANGKTVELKDNTEASSVFLEVELTDQYGKVMEPGNEGTVQGVIVTSTNPYVAAVKAQDIVVKTINNKKKFVVEFNKVDVDNNVEFRGGTAELLFISTLNGSKFTHNVTVVETKTTDAVTVSQPEIAVANEAVEIPLTVLDKEGNVITDPELLTHATKGIKVDGKPVADKKAFKVKDGQVYYVISASDNKDAKYQTLVVTTSTNKVATLTYEVKEAAKPVAVRGLKKPLVLKAKTGEKEVKFDDVNVEDQYGRTMEKLTDGYSVAVAPILEADKQAVTVTGNKVKAGDNNGTATITIFINKGNDKVANSAVEQQVRVTDGKEYTGYEIEKFDYKVKAGKQTEFTVNGILGNGKVALDPTEYTAEVVGLEGAVSGGKITVSEEALVVDEKQVTEKEFTLKVTINATGKVLEQKFTVSKAEEEIQDFFFTSSETTVKYDDAKAITEATINSATTVASALKEAGVNVAIIDQYGNSKVSDADLAKSKITVVAEKPAQVTVEENGTSGAIVKLAGDNKEAKLTLTVKIGNATKELKVTLKAN